MIVLSKVKAALGLDQMKFAATGDSNCVFELKF